MKFYFKRDEQGELVFIPRELRTFLLEVSLSVPRFKKLSLRCGIAVVMFILDSLLRTAEEEKTEEVIISPRRLNKYVKQAIKKNKKKIDKHQQIELDEDLEVITMYDKNIVIEGVKTTLEPLETSFKCELDKILTGLEKLDKLDLIMESMDKLNLTEDEVIEEVVEEQVENLEEEKETVSDTASQPQKNKRGRPKNK